MVNIITKYLVVLLQTFNWNYFTSAWSLLPNSFFFSAYRVPRLRRGVCGGREIAVSDHLWPEMDRYENDARRLESAARCGRDRVPHCRARHACTRAVARFTAALLASANTYASSRRGARRRRLRGLIISAVKKINRRQENTRERPASGQRRKL